MLPTTRALESYGLSTAAIAFLLIRATLAVVLIAISRTASVSKTGVRSPRAYIACGGWTIRVSKRRRSIATRKKPLTSAVAPASGSMVVRSPMDALSLDQLPDGRWMA